MKIKYIFLSALASVFALSSCSDALDMAPSGDIDMADVWLDNDKVGAYLNTCYVIDDRGILSWFFQTNVPVAMSDDAWDADAEVETSLGVANAYNGVASSSYHPILTSINWHGLFQGIRRCNNFLKHIPDATVDDEKDRARWKAEAHLLRAYYYAELIRYFGSMPPIITKPTSHKDDFEQYAVKSTYRELVDFIVADCDTALLEDAIPWRITNGSENGRMTKSLAMALKSRYSLYAASPLNATNQEDAMTWEEAYVINREALDALRANNFELYKTSTVPTTYDIFGARSQVKWSEGAAGAAAYHEYFCITSDISSNPRDKETIREGGGRGDIWNLCGIGFQGYYRCGFCPSQELVDQYELVSEYNSTTASASLPVLDLARPYKDVQHLEPNYNPQIFQLGPDKSYNEYVNMYQNRDPRFYATVVYNECIRTAFWKNEELDGRTGVRYVGNAMRTKTIWTNREDEYTGIHGTRRQRTRTGYYTNKYNRPDTGQGNDGGAGAKTFRFAEIILNTAECAIMSDKIEEGMTLINEIRSRVGMPKLPLNPSKEDAILYVKHERRIEFAMEDTRWDDMRRWQRPDGDMLAYQWMTGMEISWKGDDKEGKPIYTYTRKTIRKAARRCYSNRWLWVPIPLSEQNRLSSLSGHTWQNPGW